MNKTLALKKEINIGIIGYGYWGVNVLRNFMSLDNCHVQGLCELNNKLLEKAKKIYPTLQTFENYNELLRQQNLDAVAIVTPLASHYLLAKAALEAGKHIFIAKPFTANSTQAEELITLAKKNQCHIMLDHTFIFTNAVQNIKKLLNKNMLGDIYYYDSSRINLGLFRNDANVLWDLATHDLSIIDFLFEETPIGLSATGMDNFGIDKVNIAQICLYYRKKIAYINVNWLSPVKIRRTYIGGKNKMLVWNDLSSDEKIKIYNKGVLIHKNIEEKKLLTEYRIGDIHSPVINNNEALENEVLYFANCIINNQQPINDAKSGLRIIKMLEACDKSLQARGKYIELKSLPNKESNSYNLDSIKILD